MSNRNRFVIGVTLLLVVILVIEYRMPRRFEWVPTFSHTDPQPFGCLVFDSVMKASMPLGYTVEKRTLWQMEHDSVFRKPMSLLVVSEEGPEWSDAKTLMTLAGDGHTIMVATTQLTPWCDTLGIDWHWNNRFELKDVAGKRPEKGRLEWMPAAGYEEHELLMPVFDQLIERTMSLEKDSVPPQESPCPAVSPPESPDSLPESPCPAVSPPESPDSLPECPCPAVSPPESPDSLPECPCPAVSPPESVSSPEVLMEYIQPDKDTIITNPVAISFRIDKGEIILVSAPLLFTNYMTVSGNGSVVQGRLMDRLKHHSVIRSESFMSGTAMTESSPFYVFLKQPPLRWALYLALLGILLFCCFTSRRRQRVVPVIEKPQNRNVEFVQLIGTLYWQEHDNTGLLAKKLAYTKDEIRRQNVRVSPDDQYLIDRITQTVDGQFALTDQELKAYVHELNRIQQAM